MEESVKSHRIMSIRSDYLTTTQIYSDFTAVTKPMPKKPRKPYTITKKREPWTTEEHNLFLEGLRMYPNRDWKKIQQQVKTKDVVQIRYHAQKYFNKMKKEQTERPQSGIYQYNTLNIPRSTSAPLDNEENCSRLSVFSPVKNMFDYQVIESSSSGLSCPSSPCQALSRNSSECYYQCNTVYTQ